MIRLCRFRAAPLGLIVVLFSVVLNAPAATDRQDATHAFSPDQLFGVRMLRTDSSRVSKLFGRAFGGGDSVLDAAESFLTDQAELLGVASEDIFITHVLPAMYDAATDSYRFTVVQYEQRRAGYPVVNDGLRVLVSNAPPHRISLVNSDARDLGDFVPLIARQLNNFPHPVHVQSLLDQIGSDARLFDSTAVIWAGESDQPAPPRLAFRSRVKSGAQRWSAITDAATGEIIRLESRIHFGDVAGVVTGRATEDIAIDDCEPETAVPLPYVRVSDGDAETFSDANGAFHLPTMSPFVFASLDGMFFNVINAFGPDTTEAVAVDTVSLADIEFNSSNFDPTIRSQVNAYLSANRVRDFVLHHHPAFPVIGEEEHFPVHVNRTDLLCPGNAWYDPFDASINFCLAGLNNDLEMRPNTAFSSIVFHEYGHHLVEVAGSGQGQYGEGMGDVISQLMLDTPVVGEGWFNRCGGYLRNGAENFREYPCIDVVSPHDCGQLLSGAIWDVRDALASSHPNTYLEVLSPLVLSSMLLHTGGTIGQDIFIDLLALDDDNGNIFDQTPHYDAFVAGFGPRSLIPPDFTLDPIGIRIVGILPEFVDPAGTSPAIVRIEPLGGTLQPGTVVLHFENADGGGTFVDIPMQEQLETHIAAFPEGECGGDVRFYFSAESTDGLTVTIPSDAPGKTFLAQYGFGADLAVHDQFEDDLGWTTQNLGATAGFWQRGVPVDDPDWDWDPVSDSDGSGKCWLTQNEFGNTDVDNGAVRLISPPFDLTVGPPLISYDYYLLLGNNANFSDRMLVEMNDGESGGGVWHEIARHEIDGGLSWRTHEIGPDQLAAAGVAFTNAVQLRFTVNDSSPSSIVEAGLDNFRISFIACEPPDDVFGDISGEGGSADGAVDVFDLLFLLGQWGACPNCPPADACPADITDDSGQPGQSDCVVDVFDLLAILSHWTG